MKFKQAVLTTPALANAYRPGLQALKRADAEYISSKKPRNIEGSVNLDKALREIFPDDTRWDYAIGIKNKVTTSEVIWIEVHSASSTSEIDIVISKLRWLKIWAVDNAPNLLYLTREYVWVATGSVAFSQYSPQRKKLATVGILFAGSHYNIR